MAKNEYQVGDMKQNATVSRGFGPGGGRGMGGGEKANNFGKAIRELASYCKRYIPAIIAAIVLAIAGSILNIIGPGKLSDITNLITEGLFTGIDIDAVLSIVFLLVVLYALGFLFSVFQGIIMATVTQRVSKTLRTDISGKINRLPLSYFDGTSTGNILSRVTNDVDTIGQTLNQSLGTLVTSLASFLGALVMMVYTNWIMALSAVAATFIGFVLMILIISRSQKYFTQQQNELGILNGHIEETYAGHNVVKAYNGEKKAKKTFQKMNEKLYVCAWKSQFMSGLMQPLMAFIGNFGYVVVCIVGALLALNGSISFGVIVAFMLYIRMFTQPLTQLAMAATKVFSRTVTAVLLSKDGTVSLLLKNGNLIGKEQNEHGGTDSGNAEGGQNHPGEARIQRKEQCGLPSQACGGVLPGIHRQGAAGTQL